MSGRAKKTSNARSLVLLCLLLSCWWGSALMGQAQSLSCGVGVGAANYNGDLVPQIVVLSETQATIHAFAQYQLVPHLHLRGSLCWARVSGSDTHSPNAANRLRNLSFRSPIVEGSLLLVADLLPSDSRIVPYLAGGGALFWFNPKAYYQNQWVALQPLGTEGQGLDNTLPRYYQRWQIALPIGMGLRYQTDKGWQIGLEMLQRKLFTDYLDDVSTQYHANADLAERRGALAAALADRSAELTANGAPVFMAGEVRGSPNSKDWYFTLAVTFAYRFSYTRRNKGGCFGDF